MPRAALEARVARLRAAMRDDGLGAVLIYTNFPRPAAVSYLTHFIPYWSQALLAVFPDDPTVLVSSLSKRVNEWIRETSNIGELV
ncbi:MAG TPA: aminopeptidase P family N-terminal domain-containing protein, partial [Alphaproteobacteria bacterium]